MGGATSVHRETIVAARTSAVSGESVVTTIQDINNAELQYFDNLLVYLQVTQALQGTLPTLNLYLQQAVVPNPDPANNAHWSDLYAFPQITTETKEWLIPLPQTHASSATTRTAPVGYDRTHATLSADELRIGEGPYDHLRLVEKLGGTVTQAAIYSLHVTGRIK